MVVIKTKGEGVNFLDFQINKDRNTVTIHYSLFRDGPYNYYDSVDIKEFIKLTDDIKKELGDI